MYNEKEYYDNNKEKILKRIRAKRYYEKHRKEIADKSRLRYKKKKDGTWEKREVKEDDRCFNCKICFNKPAFNYKGVLHEEKYYCEDCFDKLFGKNV